MLINLFVLDYFRGLHDNNMMNLNCFDLIFHVIQWSFLLKMV
jgi:hypothetical protein